MSDENFLSDDFLRQLISVGDVDLLVGITTHNDRGTVGNVVRAVEESLLRNFLRERIVVVSVDAGSQDGTLEAIQDASSQYGASGIESLRTLRWITAKNGSDGPHGSMLRTILAAADLLHAKGSAVIAGSTENVTPAWVKSLLSPVYRENYDFVAPLYTRQKDDGLLTRNLLYPVCRALYGKPLRELRATEFAFSGKLASYCIDRGEWHNEGLDGGTEMWTAITALSNSFRCCQSYLGMKRRTRSTASVVDVIRETLHSLFWCLEATDSIWLKSGSPDALHTVGAEHQLSDDPIRADVLPQLQMYRSGMTELSQILRDILDPATHQQLLQLAALDENSFRMSNALWVRTIYEFASAYHHSRLNRDHLVQAFVPIYRGRAYSFLTQHRASDSDAMEADLEDLCQEFERQKILFIEQWLTKGQGAS